MPPPDFQREVNKQIIDNSGVADEVTEVTAASTPSPSGKREKIIYQDEDSLDQWCAIRVIKYRYRADQIKSNENVVCDIMLPMPLQLQTGYNQQWTELDDLSAILAQVASGENSAAGIQQAFQSGDALGVTSQLTGNFMRNLTKSSGAMFKNLLLNPAAAGVISGTLGAAAGGAGGALLAKLKANLGDNFTGNAAAAAGAAAAALGASASRALGTVGGLAANKYQTVTFEKPQLRQHQFSWNLVARNQKQAKRIQQIIKKLKHHSSPNQPDDSSFGYFEYPELFALHFDGGSGNTKAKGNENLFSISPSAMSSFNVDYHGAGRPLYSYTDKQPLSVTISMTLQEVVVVTKNTIEKFNR